MKALLKRVLFRTLARPALMKRWTSRLQAGNLLTILVFHRVAPPDGSAYAPLDPAMFDDTLSFLTKNFDIITFAELKTYRPSARPPMIITFDDGYKDFVEYAMPILERYKVRCNLNVIPSCVESGRPPFNIILQDFVGKAPDALLADFRVPGYGRPNLRQNKRNIGHALSTFIKRKPIAEQKSIQDILMPQIEALAGFTSTPMMTRDDVLAVASNHELGAHSYEHATLSVESDAYVIEDAKSCREYFAETIKRPTNIYALPNGGYRAHQLDLIRAEGFEHILLGDQPRSRLDALNKTRFAMYGDSPSELRCRAAGLHQVRARKRKPSRSA